MAVSEGRQGASGSFARRVRYWEIKRLVFELEQSLGGSLKTDFRFQCSSLNVSTALHPWFHWVLRFADIRQEDSKEAIHAKLNECLHDKLGFSHEVVTTSEAIMGFRSIGVEAPDEPAPQKVLARLQIALVENIINAAQDFPLLCWWKMSIGWMHLPRAWSNCLLIA